MTHSTVATDAESGGSVKTVFHTIDITSLDAAGAETYDPQTEAQLDAKSVAVVGQESASYLIAFDHLNDQLHVVNVADGTDVASATDVGEVVLRVDGV